MSRQRSFNEAVVLKKAMEVFWRKGYAATSISDLVDAMGLERGSLYHAFGSKEAIFRKAFEHYNARRQRFFVGDVPPLDGIRRIFRFVVETSANDDERRGCLLFNSATELDHLGGDFVNSIGFYLDELEGFFRVCLEAAKERGETPDDLDVTRTAQTLLALAAGMRLLGRVRPDRHFLESIMCQVDQLIAPQHNQEPACKH